MLTISELSLKYNRLMLAIVVGLMLFGAVSYIQLPAQEDPKITIREAVITTHFPGMPSEKVELLITKTIEEQVRSMPQVKEIRSISMSGTSIIHVELEEYVDAEHLDQSWDELRNEINKVRGDLPEGTSEYNVNDDFGDVAVLTVALIADERFDMGEQQDMAQHIMDMMFQVKGVKKIDLLGIQEERIYIEISNAKLAQLGISPNALIDALQQQNIIRPGGVIDANGKNFVIQPTGNFDTVEQIQNTLIAIPDIQETILLQDVATISRDIVDPPVRTAYYNGEQVIVFAIAKADSADVLKFTPDMEAMIRDLNHTIPAGYQLDYITRQADVVQLAVNGVSVSVLQTIIVVSIVVIMFLGLRTGIIVGAIVPAVILITLSTMSFYGIPLERMSLATLIIALGLLVDDGIIMAEDFKRRIEDGESRDSAVRETCRTLAIPSLTSSLTTILVFLPLMLAQSTSGEYTRSISLVILIALLISWALSLTIIMYLCHRYVRQEKNQKTHIVQRKLSAFFEALNPLYERLLRSVMHKRPLFIIVLVLLFGLGGYIMSLIPVQFFPDSDRAQVLVYLDMPAGTSMRETDETLRDIFTRLDDKERFPHINKYAAYGGFGGPRFVLSLTPIDPEPSKAFFMVDTGERKYTDPTIDALKEMFREDYPGVFAQVTKMFLGPSDSSLIEVQIKGPDPDYLYRIAEEIESELAALDGTYEIKHDWENRVTEMKVKVNQLNARRAGVTSSDIAESLETYFSGRVISEFREGDDIFPIVMRAKESERSDLDRLQSVAIYSQSRNESVPLMQVAEVEYETRFSRIARENLFRTITIEAKNSLTTAENMVPMLNPSLEKIRKRLPPAYSIEYDGVVQESKDSQASLNANLPLCIVIMVFLVIAQFGSYRATSIIFLTIPLVIIGASLGLLIMQATFGFMVILGLYALAGIIINHAIVLIDRINIERGRLSEDGHKIRPGSVDIAENAEHFEAVISASVRRLRPILMSTITTILGLMPLILSGDVLFYGQASAIAFGLAAGTMLTLGFVPVLYTYFFRITPVQKQAYYDEDQGYANA